MRTQLWTLIALTALLSDVAFGQEVLLEGQDVFEWMQAEYEEDFVVSASKRKQKLSEVPAQVSVLTREQIERSGSTSLGEILRQIPNLHVMRVSNGGYKIVPRGYSDKYLLLVDGVERNSVSNLIPDPMAFFAVTDIERIEFVHGPGSTMYGANAYSGILNIITRRATESGHTVWAETASGEWNQRYLSSGARGKEGDLDYTAVVTSNTLDSQSPYARGGAEFYSIRSGIGYQVDESHSVSLRITAQDGRYPGIYPNGYNFESPKARMQEAVLGVDGDGWRFSSFVRREVTQFEIGGLTASLTGATLTQEPWGISFINAGFVNEDMMWDNELFQVLDFDRFGTVTVGGNFRYKTNERYVADTPSQRLPYVGGDSEWRMGAFVSYDSVLVNDFIFSAGLRGDINSIDQNMLNPRLSVIYKFSDDQTLRFSFLQAFRKPTSQEFGEQFFFVVPPGNGGDIVQGLFDSYFVGRDFDSLEEVYREAQDGIGDLDLESQSVYSLELAYRDSYLQGDLDLGIDLYYELHRDAIGFVERGTISLEQRIADCAEAAGAAITSLDTPCSFVRIGNSDTPFDSAGVVLSLSYQPSDLSDWLFNSSLSFRKVARTTRRWPWGGEVSAIVEAEEASGERDSSAGAYQWEATLRQVPAWLANLGVVHAPDEGIQFGGHGYIASGATDYLFNTFYQSVTLEQRDFVQTPIQIETTIVANLHLGYKWWLDGDSWIEFGVMVQNAHDGNERETAGGVQDDLFADEYRRDPYGFDPNRVPISVAFGGERHRRVAQFYAKGAF